MDAWAAGDDSPQDDRERAQRLEALLSELATLPEPYQTQATQLVQALLELYGEALARIVASTAAAGASGEALLAAWGRDDLVGPLLTLHDLHPQSLEARVRAALEALRADLQVQGVSAALLGIADGVARVRLMRLSSGCQTCGSGARPLEQLVEEALVSTVPDLAGVRVEVAGGPQPQMITLTPRRKPVATASGASGSGV